MDWPERSRFGLIFPLVKRGPNRFRIGPDRARLAARELGGLAGFFLVFERLNLLVHPGARFFGGIVLVFICARLEFDGIDQAPLLPALLGPSPGASDAVSSIAGSAKTHF